MCDQVRVSDISFAYGEVVDVGVENMYSGRLDTESHKLERLLFNGHMCNLPHMLQRWGSVPRWI